MPFTHFNVYFIALIAVQVYALPIPLHNTLLQLITPSQPEPVLLSTPATTISSAFMSASGSTHTSATSYSPVSTQPPISSPGPGNGKFVVAHHMVGNVYPYTKQDWVEDINLAQAAAIDAFALNTGTFDWQPERINDAYEAAKENGRFKMFLSLDMAVFPCNSPQDAANLRQLVIRFMNHPAQFKISDKAFVSTFAGETCTFGSESPTQGWFDQFAGHPDLQGKIHFVPSFFVDPAEFAEGKAFAKSLDGVFNWNGAWPIELTTDKVRGSGGQLGPIGIAQGTQNAGISDSLSGLLGKFIGSTDPDKPYMDAIKGKTYMTSVSPWFFTHYGVDSFNKNFLYVSDHHLLSHRFQSLLDPETSSSIDILQLLSWNDYGESHYFGPIKGAQPNSQAWVDGFDHTGWLTLIRHFASQFKSQPTTQGDAIIGWARPHTANTQVNDPVGQPKNFELVEDKSWFAFFASQPSTLVLGSSKEDNNPIRQDIPPGLSLVERPLRVGDTIYARLERNGFAGLELDAAGKFTFRDHAEKGYNFNVAVFSIGDTVKV